MFHFIVKSKITSWHLFYQFSRSCCTILLWNILFQIRSCFQTYLCYIYMLLSFSIAFILYFPTVFIYLKFVSITIYSRKTSSSFFNFPVILYVSYYIYELLEFYFNKIKLLFRTKSQKTAEIPTNPKCNISREKFHRYIPITYRYYQNYNIKMNKVSSTNTTFFGIFSNY